MRKISIPLLAISLMLTVQSCKEPKIKDYTIPTTYNFVNADYSEQSLRLSMITVLVDEVKKANTAGVHLDAQQLKNMFSNSGTPFSNDTLNTSGKQLKDQTFSDDQWAIENWIDEAATTSLANATGSNGAAGIVTNGVKSYLQDAKGKDYKEAVEKNLQGGLLYYQITAVALSNEQVGPNVPLADRQKHWDAAFGYFGVPADYPINTTGLRHVGKYANDRNAIVGNATKVMNAFLKGRAAIDNGDDATVTAQISIIRDNVEIGVAATAVHYINSSLASLTDNAVRNHSLSEGYFLVKSLRYNPTKKATDAQIATLLGYFGTSFYTVSETDLQAAKDLLSSIYGFNSYKDQL